MGFRYFLGNHDCVLCRVGTLSSSIPNAKVTLTATMAIEAPVALRWKPQRWFRCRFWRAKINTLSTSPGCLMSINPLFRRFWLAFTILVWLLGLGLVLLLGRRLAMRLQLSRAKHRSLAGHVRLGRRLARLIPYYEYDEEQFFRADDAPEEVARQRRAAFMRLAAN